MIKNNMVFLHGFPLNGTSWEPQRAYFSEKFNVFTPDLRGHGAAHAPEGPWFMHHFAYDLKNFFDQQKIDKAVVCGLSMGGYVALHFAQMFPEKISALILADTSPDADSNETKDKRFSTLEKIEKEGLPAFASDFSRNALSEFCMQEKPRLRESVEEMINGNKSANVKMALGALVSRRDSTPYLSAIVCPTLLLVGEQDKITPPQLSEKMAALIPGAMLQVIKNSGHLSNLEQPEDFNHKVEEFLQKQL